MGASSLLTSLTGLAACVLAGCGGGVIQPGLANAPSLNGTPETRVHDAIANGHDACERAMFPQGEVLRGQVPPCGNESHSKASASTPKAAAAGASLSVPATEFCPPGRPSANAGMAFQLSEDPWWLPCAKRWRGDD